MYHYALCMWSKIEPRTSYMLSKHSAIEATSPCLFSECSSWANTCDGRPETLHRAWPMVGTFILPRNRQQTNNNKTKKPWSLYRPDPGRPPFLVLFPNAPGFYLAWIAPIQASPRQYGFSFLPTSLVVGSQLRTVTLLSTQIIHSRCGDRL